MRGLCDAANGRGGCPAGIGGMPGLIQIVSNTRARLDGRGSNFEKGIGKWKYQVAGTLYIKIVLYNNPRPSSYVSLLTHVSGPLCPPGTRAGNIVTWPRKGRKIDYILILAIKILLQCVNWFTLRVLSLTRHLGPGLVHSLLAGALEGTFTLEGLSEALDLVHSLLAGALEGTFTLEVLSETLERTFTLEGLKRTFTLEGLSEALEGTFTLEGLSEALEGTFTLEVLSEALEGTFTLEGLSEPHHNWVGVTTLALGTACLYRGVTTQALGTACLYRGVTTLPLGTACLYRGVTTLALGTACLYRGVTTLPLGTACLYRGVTTLALGTACLYRGQPLLQGNPFSSGEQWLNRALCVVVVLDLCDIEWGEKAAAAIAVICLLSDPMKVSHDLANARMCSYSKRCRTPIIMTTRITTECSVELETCDETRVCGLKSARTPSTNATNAQEIEALTNQHRVQGATDHFGGYAGTSVPLEPRVPGVIYRVGSPRGQRGSRFTKPGRGRRGDALYYLYKQIVSCACAVVTQPDLSGTCGAGSDKPTAATLAPPSPCLGGTRLTPFCVSIGAGCNVLFRCSGKLISPGEHGVEIMGLVSEIGRVRERERERERAAPESCSEQPRCFWCSAVRVVWARRTPASYRLYHPHYITLLAFEVTLVESLKSKLGKVSEEVEHLEAVEVDIEQAHRKLQELQKEVRGLYVFGEDVDAAQSDLQSLKGRVDSSISQAKTLVSETKDHYIGLQQLVPTDIAQQLSSLELLWETVSGAMEEKSRDLKRARTVRSEYNVDVDEVQDWLQRAEAQVQDRSVDPHQQKEHLTKFQGELSSVDDRMERLTKNGGVLIGNSHDDGEKALVQSTINTLTERLQQFRSCLEQKKHQVGDTLDSWQRFMTMYQAVKSWVDEKQTFLVEPLQLSSLTQARQKVHDYSTAVKTCKQMTKNLSDMSKELENIGKVNSVGDLPEKLEEAEEAKGEVEAQLLERYSKNNESCRIYDPPRQSDGLFGTPAEFMEVKCRNVCAACKHRE
uniref:Uncharacterized protein n=1 Tax=Timema monikensis TaxID=170555 RepID=A0A7R9EFI3_9NEOP|nr:unnamed protein product [Timema monikensis]